MRVYIDSRDESFGRAFRRQHESDAADIRASIERQNRKPVRPWSRRIVEADFDE